MIERRETPRGEWVLRERDTAVGKVFEVIANGTFLMDSREATSERALASLALAGRPGARVLVGGLGLGFTLRACLELDPAHVEVVEIEPALVEWVRGPVASELGDPLADPRVAVTVGDVHDVVGQRPGAFDAVLLDTDNGPSWLVDPDNARLYERDGLERAVGALRPGGALAVWAAAAEPALLDGMAAFLTDAREERVEVRREGRDLDYFIYVGIRPGT
ncbi:MAG: hypothetical protein H6719_10535 [Sandaracinaceae bacterium]|nr:hypothetical protein [Sandaracinaceae bacterium]